MCGPSLYKDLSFLLVFLFGALLSLLNIMYHQHLITKTLLLCYFLIIVVQAKSIKKTWSFKNWNKYKDSSVGQGSNWSRPWGISEDNGWLWMWNSADSVKHVIKKDPSRRSSDMTLRVEYPAHSRNPDSNPVGGLGFKAKPIKIDTNVKKVELSYSVYFPKQFNFVKGIIDILYGLPYSC